MVRSQYALVIHLGLERRSIYIHSPANRERYVALTDDRKLAFTTEDSWNTEKIKDLNFGHRFTQMKHRLDLSLSDFVWNTTRGQHKGITQERDGFDRGTGSTLVPDAGWRAAGIWDLDGPQRQYHVATDEF